MGGCGGGNRLKVNGNLLLYSEKKTRMLQRRATDHSVCSENCLRSLLLTLTFHGISQRRRRNGQLIPFSIYQNASLPRLSTVNFSLRIHKTHFIGNLYVIYRTAVSSSLDPKTLEVRNPRVQAICATRDKSRNRTLHFLQCEI